MEDGSGVGCEQIGVPVNLVVRYTHAPGNYSLNRDDDI